MIITKRQTLFDLLTTAVLLAAAAALLLYPKEVSQAVLDGLDLCIGTLLPSLFPFFVLSSLLIRTGLARRFGRLLDPIMGPLFCLPGHCSPVPVLGLIGGYPTGAKTVVELYRSGQCSRSEAQRLLCFCNNCGPAFIIGTLGGSVFDDPRCGLLLLIVHIAAAVLTGSWMAGEEYASSTPQLRKNSGETCGICSAFVNSVTGSLRAMMDLFSFVLCFSAVTCLLEMSGIPARLGQLLPVQLSAENRVSFLLGLLEMSHGALSLTGGSIRERLILTAILLGWGGLSVHCQVMALLQDTDLSPTSYFLGKALHAVLSALLMAAAVSNSPFVFLLLMPALLFPRQIPKKAVENLRPMYYNVKKETKGAEEL